MVTVPHRFSERDLVGGDPVLDLVNTVTAWNAEPVDWLDSYARVLEWGKLAGIVDSSALAVLEPLQRSDPQGGQQALANTRTLRGLLYGCLTAMIRGETKAPDYLARLEEIWKEAVAHARFDLSTGRLRLAPAVDRSGLEYVNHVLALRACALLQSLPLERVRICAGERCGWVFIDRSKGGRRRWCDMATCGNAAKARRFVQRRRARRAGASPAPRSEEGHPRAHD